MVQDKRLLEMFGKFKAKELANSELQVHVNTLELANGELRAHVSTLESRMQDVVQNSAAAADGEIAARRENEQRLVDKIALLEQQYVDQSKDLANSRDAASAAELQVAARAQEHVATTDALEEVNTQLANLENERASFDIRTEAAEREFAELQTSLSAAATKVHAAASNLTGAELPTGAMPESRWREQLASICSHFGAQATEQQILVRANASLAEERDQLLLESQRLKDLSVDKEAMLNRARGDAEAISRATLQNKELKSRIAELEMRFVELSQKSMQYASELETARFYAHGRGPGAPSGLSASPAAPDRAVTVFTSPTSALPASSLSNPASSPTKSNPFNASPTRPPARALALLPISNAADVDANYVGAKGTNLGVEADGSGDSTDATATSRSSIFDYSSDESDAGSNDADGAFPAATSSAFDAGPSASSRPAPLVRLDDQAINEDLQAQIVQLEMERQQLVAQVVELKIAASESRRSSLPSSGAGTANEPSGSNKPMVTVAGFVQGGGTLDGGNGNSSDSSSSGNGNGNGNGNTNAGGIVNNNVSLPRLPDGSRPNQDAMMKVAVIKLERELDLVKDEFDELKARYLHVVGEKSDLLKRIRREEELTTQLAAETDQIGDYIALYQEHRNKSNDKLKIKDRMLAELGSQNELLEVELAESRMVLAELCTRLKATTKQAPPALREGLIRIAADLHRPLEVIDSIASAAAFDGADFMSLAPTARTPMIPDWCLDNTFRVL